jgi:hypothetical protein
MTPKRAVMRARVLAWNVALRLRVIGDDDSSVAVGTSTGKWRLVVSEVEISRMRMLELAWSSVYGLA